MKNLVLVCWGYMVEIALSILIYALFLLLCGPERLASYFSSTWIAWSTVCGIVLASAIALYAMVFQMMTSDFGGFLVARGADGHFLKAYVFAILVSFLGTISFIISGNVNSAVATHAAGFLLVLVAINLYTMVSNSLVLQSLRAEFEKAAQREKQCHQ